MELTREQRQAIGLANSVIMVADKFIGKVNSGRARSAETYADMLKLKTEALFLKETLKKHETTCCIAGVHIPLRCYCPCTCFSEKKSTKYGVDSLERNLAPVNMECCTKCFIPNMGDPSCSDFTGCECHRSPLT